MENFCPQPWVGIDIDPQGKIKPCCRYLDTISDDINDYFESDQLNELKQQFLNNQKPEGCKRCWDDEDAGQQSKRLLDLQYSLSNTDLSKIKLISIPFGNTCNLKCRTCNSGSSSKWAADEKKLQSSFPQIQIFDHKQYYKQKDFLNFLYGLSDNLDSVTFPGGESFITGIEEQLNYLDFLLSKNPQNIVLNYITNSTTFPSDEFWKRWNRFKKVNIQLSLDGLNEKFEYIRYPASWNEVYNNIKLYQNKQNSAKNLQLSIGHTVSIFNILDVKEFTMWCIKEKLPKPHFNLVSHPEYYNIRFLPTEVKTIIAKHLGGGFFQPLIDYMSASTTTKSDLLFQWIIAVDKIRNQSFRTTFPEMANLLDANK